MSPRLSEARMAWDHLETTLTYSRISKLGLFPARALSTECSPSVRKEHTQLWWIREAPSLLCLHRYFNLFTSSGMLRLKGLIVLLILTSVKQLHLARRWLRASNLLGSWLLEEVKLGERLFSKSCLQSTFSKLQISVNLQLQRTNLTNLTTKTSSSVSYS